MRRLIHRYLEHLQGERQLSPQTLRAYEHDLVTFHEFLSRDFLGKEPDAVRPEDVDPLAVRSFLAALTRAGLGKRSQGRALSAVRSLFRFACREGTLEANPAQGVKTPKAPKTLPRHLRPGEVESLIEAPEGDGPLIPRDRAILELLYAAGLRVSELVGLDWPDVDLSARMVRVMGKGSKERMVPFGRPAAEALRRWLERWNGRPTRTWFLRRSTSRWRRSTWIVSHERWSQGRRRRHRRTTRWWCNWSKRISERRRRCTSVLKGRASKRWWWRQLCSF